MAQAASLRPTDHVLEVGCGSGYGAAVLAEIAGDVVTIEIRPRLAIDAQRRLADIGCTNVRVVVGDGSLGWPDLAPYDAIIVTAATPQLLPSLVEQLSDAGGRLVAPVGTIDRQVLQRAVREGTSVRVDILGEVRFVPLVGAAGFAGRDPLRRN